MARRKSSPRRYPTYESKRVCREGQVGSAYNLRSHPPPQPPVLPEPSIPQPDLIDDPTDAPAEPVVFSVEDRRRRAGFSYDRITATGETSDYGVVLNDVQEHIKPILEKEVARQGGVKFHLTFGVRFKNEKTDHPKGNVDDYFFNVDAARLLPTDNIDQEISKMTTSFVKQIDEHMENGSGWSVDAFNFMDVYCHRYRPLRGDSYIATPKYLANKKAIVNVQNKDNKCFMWSVLAHLHPTDSHTEQLSKYTTFENELNFTGIPFPVTLDAIDLFESQNGLAVNVYGYETCLHPLRLTKNRTGNVIHLLLLTKAATTHYCLIKKLDSLLFDQNKHEQRKFFCQYCLTKFTTLEKLEKHATVCENGASQIEMPEDTHLYFRNIHKQLWSPILISADFEAFNVPYDTCNPDPDFSSTTIKTVHEPNSFGCVSAHSCGCHKVDFKDFEIYRGESPVERFLEHILKVSEAHQRTMDVIKQMDPTDDDKVKYKVATDCSICLKPLDEERVRDHCHICGKFRGAAHSNCNLNYFTTRDVPVVFHNLQRYDAHLIMQKVSKFSKNRGFSLTCVPKTLERYLAFSIRVPWTIYSKHFPNGYKKTSFNIRFIDSCQFLQSSLATQVEMLAETGDEKFVALRKFFPDNTLRQLLLRKNAFPYDWLTGWDKFNELQLPPPEAFYNVMDMKAIDPDTYKHSQTVWETVGCTNFGDYSDLYLKSDVLHLADIFENFRHVCKENYNLDPAHYISIPSFAWDACLRYTGVELELLTDPDDYQFLEEGMRGGISVVSGRFARANNPYMGDEYKPTEPNSYIMYLDANNLYGWSMSQSLPVGDFRWLTDKELKPINKEFVLSTLDDAPTARIYQVDLEVPIGVHDAHNDYPLAPESVLITEEMLSPYSRQLRQRLKKSNGPCRKLTPNLYNKKDYIVHERNLKLYLQQGLKLAKVHRAFEFSQAPWIKPYIDFNTTKRTAAKTKFEQDFFKLLNNSVFGKSMENVRKYKEIKLVMDQAKLDKLVAKPLYKNATYFGGDLWAVSMTKEKIVLEKPIYTGFSVLDISKVIMYRFHYDYIVPRYGHKARLMFTDTDSLCYHIETDDVYKDTLAVKKEWFDCSGYPKDHVLYDPENKKVIGMMKDEFPGEEMPTEFVGLRSKMYSVAGLRSGKRVAKGVPRQYVAKRIRHENYKEALKGLEEQKAEFLRIQSFKHKIYTVRGVKTSLSAYDDKRFILPDGNFTLAHGHYKCDVHNVVTDIVNDVSCSVE